MAGWKHEASAVGVCLKSQKGKEKKKVGRKKLKTDPEGCVPGNAEPACQKSVDHLGCVEVISEQFRGQKQICK